MDDDTLDTNAPDDNNAEILLPDPDPATAKDLHKGLKRIWRYLDAAVDTFGPMAYDYQANMGQKRSKKKARLAAAEIVHGLSEVEDLVADLLLFVPDGCPACERLTRVAEAEAAETPSESLLAEAQDTIKFLEGCVQDANDAAGEYITEIERLRDSLEWIVKDAAVLCGTQYHSNAEDESVRGCVDRAHVFGTRARAALGIGAAVQEDAGDPVTDASTVFARIEVDVSEAERGYRALEEYVKANSLVVSTPNVLSDEARIEQHAWDDGWSAAWKIAVAANRQMEDEIKAAERRAEKLARKLRKSRRETTRIRDSWQELSEELDKAQQATAAMFMATPLRPATDLIDQEDADSAGCLCLDHSPYKGACSCPHCYGRPVEQSDQMWAPEPHTCPPCDREHAPDAGFAGPVTESLVQETIDRLIASMNMGIWPKPVGDTLRIPRPTRNDEASS